MGYKPVVLFLAIAALYACSDTTGPTDADRWAPQVFLSVELHASRLGEPARITGPTVVMAGDSLVATISVYNLGPGTVRIQGLLFSFVRQNEDGLPIRILVRDERMPFREIPAGDSVVVTPRILIKDSHGPAGTQWRASAFVDGVQFWGPVMQFTE